MHLAAAAATTHLSLCKVECCFLPAGFLASQPPNELLCPVQFDAAHLNVTPEVNIVEKVLCVVSEDEGVVTFSEVNSEYNTSDRRAIATGESGVEWRSVIIGKVCAIENKVQDIVNEHAGHYGEVIKRLDRMDQNMKRLAVIPARRIHNLGAESGGVGSNETELVRPPNLCRCPKNLYVLWSEFESGVGGNKQLDCSLHQRGGK